MKYSRRDVSRKTHARARPRSESHQLTSFGGLIVLQEFFAELNLAERLRNVFHRRQSGKVYRPQQLFLQGVGRRRGVPRGPLSVYNKRKKGARSYYPLFCTIAQSGQVLAHNLLREQQMRGRSRERRTTGKRAALWGFETVGTLHCKCAEFCFWGKVLRSHNLTRQRGTIFHNPTRQRRTWSCST